MLNTVRISKKLVYLFELVVLLIFMPSMALASNLPAIPSSETSNGSVGLIGTIPSPPPTQAATITTPVNGATFTSLPINVDGLCPKSLLIKVFSNNVFIGSTICQSGSYSIPVDLFSGQNDLVAKDYDSLEQSGPVSNSVSVTFSNSLLANFGSIVNLTSNYARRGADPNQTLTWPFIITGGSGPYAISIDWGDNSPIDLISTQFAGTINTSHVYKTAGTYTITVKATDKNNSQAFLQVVGIANGAITNLTSSQSQSSSVVYNQKPQIIWWPALLMVPLIVASFWIGGKYQLTALRKELEKQRG